VVKPIKHYEKNGAYGARVIPSSTGWIVSQMVQDKKGGRYKKDSSVGDVFIDRTTPSGTPKEISQMLQKIQAALNGEFTANTSLAK
jgi:hypothetical protein